MNERITNIDGHKKKIHEQIKWRLAILLIVCLDDFHSKAEAHSEIRLLEFKGHDCWNNGDPVNEYTFLVVYSSQFHDIWERAKHVSQPKFGRSRFGKYDGQTDL